jgi:hypothetical protein
MSQACAGLVASGAVEYAAWTHLLTSTMLTPALTLKFVMNSNAISSVVLDIPHAFENTLILLRLMTTVAKLSFKYRSVIGPAWLLVGTPTTNEASSRLTEALDIS